MIETAKELWRYVLVTAPSGQTITVGQLAAVLLLLLFGYFASRFVGFLIGRRLAATKLRPDVVHIFKRIAFFAILVVVVITALGLLGIPLTAFAFATGAIAIGVGFGAQNIINNFISGWILMAERPIRIDDYIELDAVQGTVERIGNRSTRIRRTDGVHLLVPNSHLLENTVVNWTLVDQEIRTTVRVGVAYGSPVRKVASLIMEAITSQPEVKQEPAPSVIFEDFGDNALIFDAYFWCDVSGDRVLREFRSEIRFRITDLFKENGIVVAFPQRDVHLDSVDPLRVHLMPVGEEPAGKLGPRDLDMDTVGYSVIAVLVLLAANAFFVAAEFALVKVRGFQLHQAVAEGRRAANLSVRMHRNLDAYLAACQLGITMASLGLGWVGEPAVAALLEPSLSKFDISEQSLHTISFLVGFLLFSSLHIVVGEQVPKTYAIRKAQPVTLLLAYPLLWFYWLVFPLNWLLDRANAGVLRLIGVAEAPHHEIISEDEISSIVEHSEAHGEIEEKTAEIIRKAFRFDDQTVREVMVPWSDVATLSLSAAPSVNQSIVLETLHSRFPVIDASGDVVGILATKDLISTLLGEEDDVWSSIENRLRPPLVIPRSLLISSLLERMRSTRTRLAIVIDEHGNYVGIVSLEDMLEEIVGEIEDEWDTDEGIAAIVETSAGWEMSGQVPLSQVGLMLGQDIASAPGVTTLGGLVMARLGHLPKEGDQIQEANYEFFVAKMKGRRVERVLISRVKTR